MLNLMYPEWISNMRWSFWLRPYIIKPSSSVVLKRNAMWLVGVVPNLSGTFDAMYSLPEKVSTSASIEIKITQVKTKYKYLDLLNCIIGGVVRQSGERMNTINQWRILLSLDLYRVCLTWVFSLTTPLYRSYLRYKLLRRNQSQHNRKWLPWYH